MGNEIEGFPSSGDAASNEVKEVGEARLEEFYRLVNYCVQTAARIVEGNKGKVNPEAAINDATGFIQVLRPLARKLKQAYDMIPEHAGKSALAANSSWGWLMDPRMKDGTQVSDSVNFIRRIRGDQATEDTKRQWVDYCQEFIDKMQEMLNEFKSFDRANDGALSAGIRRGKEE